jgi:hypothetical protein
VCEWIVITGSAPTRTSLSSLALYSSSSYLHLDYISKDTLAMASRDLSRRQDQYKGKAQFKNDELRRRREEAQVEIRRQKRDESMAKRRNLDTAAQGAMTDGDSDEEEINGGLLEKQVR